MTEADQLAESTGFLRRVARSGAWNALSFFGAAAASFAIAIVVGRATGPTGFGRFAYYTWLMRVVPAVLALGLPVALTRFIPEFLGGGETSDAAGVRGLTFRVGAILMLVCGASVAYVATAAKEPTYLVIALAFGSSLTLLVKLFEGLLQGLRRFRQMALIVSFSSIFQLAMVVIAALMGAGYRLLISLFAAGMVIIAASLAVITVRSTKGWGRGALSRETRRKVIKFALMLGVVAVIDEVVYGRPEIFFLERYRTAAEIGFYGAGLKFASLVVILPGVVSRSLLPEFAWMVGGKQQEKFHAVFPVLCRVVALIAAGLAFIGAAFSDVLITVFYGPSFSPAIPGAAVLLAGSVFGGVAGPVAAALFAGSKERFFVQAGVVLVVLNIVLDMLLIPQHGLAGAAIATIVSQTVGIGLGFFLAMRRAALPYPMADVVKILLLAAASGAAVRWVSQPLSPAVALFGGGFAAFALYIVLADRLGLVRLAQLRDMSRRPAPN